MTHIGEELNAMAQSSIKNPIVYYMVLVFVLMIISTLMFFHLPLSSDALTYYRMSLDFLKGQPSTFEYPLGWPVMMAIAQRILGESQAVAKGLSSVLVLLTLGLQFYIVQRTLGYDVLTWRCWLGYSIVLVNTPHLLYHANFTFTVVPMVFWGTLLVYALLYTNSYSVAALLLSIMITVRFGSIFLLPFILIYYWIRGISYRSLIITCVLVIFFISIPIAFVSVTKRKLILLNTGNSLNLFFGNHRLAPVYETWLWGSHDTEEKRRAMQELEKDYHLSSNAREAYQVMQEEAVKQIVSYPRLFALRVLTRLSVLLAFDSSVGADEIHKGNKIYGIVLLVVMLIISLSTKLGAIIGLFGTEWPGRHLIWALLIGLSFPHIIAFAHPSYFQMFMNIAIPVVALSAAQAEFDRLRSFQTFVITMALIVLLCHLAFIYYMTNTRL